MTTWRVSLALLGLTFAACSHGRQATSSHQGPHESDDDLQILDEARRRLTDERTWNRNDNRECPAGARSWSLFCALHDASIEAIGTYDHRRLALEEVRAAIEEIAGESFHHRLMDFNNRPSTTLADVHRVIEIARARVAQRAGNERPR
jgi:hypothetical protein